MKSSRASEHGFEVLSNEQAAQGIWRLRIASDVAQGLRPGQFMNLRVPGNDARVLRLPLSFSWSNAASGEVELLYALVGEGTARLSQMRPGASSTLVGPCGNGWRLPGREGRALLVAGGIGLPPVMAAARLLAQAGVGFDAVVGAKTQAMLVFPEVEDLRGLSCEGVAAKEADPGRMVVLTTDDGTGGEGPGPARYATDGMAELLAARSYAQVYACGPAVMMAGVARLAGERDIPCQVSMERMMGCGFGACSCCNVALASGGYALCCTDGPVFDAREVAW